MCWFSRIVFYPWSYYFTEKNKTHHQTFTCNSLTTDFRVTFLYNRRCLTSGKTKSRDENKVAAKLNKQGNFYWERRLCLFWILYKESITMLLVSLVHQLIWPTFTLVFTRNGIFKYSQKPWMRLTLTITSIFTISDRAAFRGTFRIEANQKSKVELYSCKSASWTSWRLQAVKHFHKVPSSMLDCVQSRHRQ